jgi:hypothetical protein
MQALWKKIQNLLVSRELTLPSGQVINNSRQVTVSGAAIVLNVRDHADKPIVLDRAAGVTVTLPRATGSGARFEIYIATTVTSNNDIIKVDNSTDVMQGRVTQSADGGNTVAVYDTAATDDTLTMDGSTKGGLAGDRYLLTDMKPGFWALDAFQSATGTEASPLSATV